MCIYTLNKQSEITTSVISYKANSITWCQKSQIRLGSFINATQFHLSFEPGGIRECPLAKQEVVKISFILNCTGHFVPSTQAFAGYWYVLMGRTISTYMLRLIFSTGNGRVTLPLVGKARTSTYVSHMDTIWKTLMIKCRPTGCTSSKRFHSPPPVKLSTYEYCALSIIAQDGVHISPLPDDLGLHFPHHRKSGVKICFFFSITTKSFKVYP